MRREMNRWTGRTVIGLTGNIGTGKSIVRRMLESLGALGIDADELSHKVIEKGSPAYFPVVEYFGRSILSQNDEIDRARLGRIVFSDLHSLQVLESIIHPKVNEAVDAIIQQSEKIVIVVEAIKLLEGTIGKDCNTIWVVKASPEIQLKRLMNDRKMTEEDAFQRIHAQPSQELKIKNADEVIDNGGTLAETWQQVKDAWQRLFPDAEIPETFKDQAPNN